MIALDQQPEWLREAYFKNILVYRAYREALYDGSTEQQFYMSLSKILLDHSERLKDDLVKVIKSQPIVIIKDSNEPS